MDPNQNLQQTTTPESTISNKENDIFNLIIKISIPVIIFLLITILLIIFKPWKNLRLSFPSFINIGGQTISQTNKYLEISSPLHTLTGTISKINSNQLYLEVPISDQTATIPININKNTSIIHVPQASSLSSAEISQTPEPLSPDQLAVNSEVVVSTVEDIRKYNGGPLNATTITILNNITVGTVDSIDGNSIKVITSNLGTKQVFVGNTTRILLGNNRYSINIGLNGITPRDGISIFSDVPTQKTTSIINASEIFISPPVVGIVKEINTSTLIIEVEKNDKTIKDLSANIDSNTSYSLYSAGNNQINTTSGDQIIIGDIVAIYSSDYNPDIDQATVQGIKIYRP